MHLVGIERVLFLADAQQSVFGELKYLRVQQAVLLCRLEVTKARVMSKTDLSPYFSSKARVYQ